MGSQGKVLTCHREVISGLDFYQTEETIFGETDEEKEYSPIARSEDLENGV